MQELFDWRSSSYYYIIVSSSLKAQTYVFICGAAPQSFRCPGVSFSDVDLINLSLMNLMNVFLTEFDDLEMCTSLDCGSQWWPASSSSSTFTKTTTQSDDSSLQRLVEDLRSQLTCSQAVIRGLQSRLRSLSTSSDYGPSTPRKVNWSFQAASPSQSGAEDDEGWQSSDGGPLASPRHPHSDKGLRELVSRVDALEDQLRKGGKKSVSEDRKSATWPG